MRIRKMRPDDAVSVARIHRNTIRGVNNQDYSVPDIRAWSDRISARWIKENFTSEIHYVAEDKGRIVGFINLSTSAKKVNALYVSKNWLGKGVGTRLLKKAEQVSWRQGNKEIRLHSTITAKGFYMHLGYRSTGKTQEPSGGRKIAVYKMVKDLTT